MRTWALLLLSLLLLSAESPPQNQVLNITLTVYGDGAVRIKEELQVDLASAETRIQTLGLLPTDIIVRTESGDVVNQTYWDGYIIVESPGSIRLTVTYTMSELTSKNGSRWRLAAALPTNAVIKLPDASTIVDLDPIPIGISNVGITTTLLMPAGNVTVEYYIGVTGTKEHALALLNDLEGTIQALQQRGYNTSSIDTDYAEVKQAFEGKQYIEAETLALRVKDAADQMGELAARASEAIGAADLAIVEAKSQGRTEDLTHASDLLADSRVSFSSGNFSEALDKADSAKQWADSSRPALNPLPSWLIPVASIAGVLLVGSFLYTRRKPGGGVQIVGNVDVDQIRMDHPEIRDDDLPALRFIAEHPEGVYISRLRESLKMPRSTAWRTVTRLEETGVVKTMQLGRETFIKLSDVYLKT